MQRINLFPLLALLLLLTSCVSVKKGNEANLEKASDINVQLGIGYYHRGNLELANEKLVKAIKQNPASSQAHHAYAVLQNRFLNAEKAELHFKKAIELDPGNSEALNNFGAYLCSAERYKEADAMFMQAVKNPLYRSPEVAYTSAAVCILKEGPSQQPKAKQYLSKALAIGNNFRPALINMAELTFIEQNNEMTGLYLQRYHVAGAATARSLWLSIQNEMDKGNKSRAQELAEQLKQDFVNSKEYEQWLALNK